MAAQVMLSIAGLVAKPESWAYSNYAEWVEIRNGTLVDREFVKSYFKTAEEYREFVLSYLEGEKSIDGLERYYLE
ncbi:MAG: hypothetical protein ACE5IY_23465 [bacterium]